jgi:acetylornithine deacetylase/succinyl-diaminopimelate desuccinylase-like protein
MTLLDALAKADANLTGALDRLFDFVRIPSISTDADFAVDCGRAADWLVAELTELGATAAVHPTEGHPMVIGHLPGDGPHLLFYGHYDVQPVDPLDLWDHAPFDPEIADSPAGQVIRGRGASDDKGQLMTFLEAIRAWRETIGPLPVRITFLFEGEEEIGSPSILPFLQQHADTLSADLALICDTRMYDGRVPAIVSSLRGLLGQEVTLKAADRDLHSGGYGGPAANPLRLLSQVLASLHDDKGRVTLAGFYDGVPELSAALRDDWASLGMETAGFLGPVGLSQLAGEEGYSVPELLWARPTCEINGVSGGYTGEGFKTVLPAEATAKVSFRLVGTQDPETIRAAFRDHVIRRLPADVNAEFTDHGAAPAAIINTSNPVFERARAALSDEWGVPAVYIGGGGSIPVGNYFKSELGMDSMFIGFARDDDRVHSPNEKYNVESFHKGTRSWIRVLAAIGIPEEC